MSGILSVNILTQFLQDPNGVLPFLEVLKPTAVLVMDSMGIAQQIKQRLPNCIVIHRTWHPRDHEFPNEVQPEWFIQNYCQNVPAGIVVQCCNEPTGYGNLAGNALWFKTVMDLSPVPLALPNWGVGHPREDFGTDLDPMLLAFGRNPEHLLAVHEYFQQEPAGEQPFHIKRFQSIITRCQQLGIPPPKIVVTEAGRDVGGGARDGWRGTGWSEVTYGAKLQQQATLYKNTPVVGMCVFCMGKGGGSMWESFDFETAGTVKQMMIDWNGANPMTNTIPAPTTGGVRAKLTAVPAGVTYRNIRNQPDGTDIGDLLVGDEVIYYPQATSGTWVYVNPINQVPRPAGRQPAVDGWTSTNDVTFTPVTPSATSGLTQEQWDRLDIANRAIKLATAQIDTLLEEVKPSSSDGGF